jgi:hypothetical protein
VVRFPLAAQTPPPTYRCRQTWRVMATRDRGRIWFAVAGAVIGVALGILVSVVTDVPFAPEAGLLIGALVGWFLTR